MSGKLSKSLKGIYGGSLLFSDILGGGRGRKVQKREQEYQNYGSFGAFVYYRWPYYFRLVC